MMRRICCASAEDDKYALTIRNGHFSWKTEGDAHQQEDMEPTGTLELSNISLDIKQVRGDEQSVPVTRYATWLLAHLMEF